MFEEFPYAIIAISKSQSGDVQYVSHTFFCCVFAFCVFPFLRVCFFGAKTRVLDNNTTQKLALQNEALIAANEFANNYVEFTYPMSAKNNSIDCLKNNECLPVGGYSVWSTFDNISNVSFFYF